MDIPDNNNAYELSRAFPVPEETLFKTFIDEAILKEIWGVSSINVDARPGGQARALLEIDGESWDFTLSYKEVVPGEKLRWIVHFDRFPTKEIRVTLLFKPTIDGTEVTIRMENFETSEERDANKHAWEAGLTKLEELIRKQ